MPKYYCCSGDFRLLCDAPDPVAAGTRLVARAMEAMDAGGAGGLGFLIAVSERGYDDPQAGMLPAIPLARDVGWEAAIKPELRRTLRAMPPGGRDWLLGGGGVADNSGGDADA